MKIDFAPKSQAGKLSVFLIVLMPLFIYIGMSFVDFYASTQAGPTIPQDIIARPGIALPILAGFISGIAALFAGIMGITRKKDRSILVFLSTTMGFLTLLWCLAEILFPHPQPATTEPQPSMSLVEIGGEASCVQIQLQDEQGNQIDVPAEINNAFQCATGAIALSPDNNFLLYENNLHLKIYDLETHATTELMSFNETLEGLSCNWREDSQVIACVAVNQQDYEGLTKIFVLTIDKNGQLRNKQEFAQKPGETVDFVCGASCYPGNFRFENGNTLQYDGHNAISPGTIYSITY